MCGNGVIGRDGELPWRLPTDLRRFRELTTGHPVVMGRKTFESLPPRFRPLPGRRNLVLSTNPAFSAAGAEVFSDLEQALEACAGERCFVIGGGVVFTHALPVADRVYATEVDGLFEGDAVFPSLSADVWTRVAEEGPLEENGHTFRFVEYERRR